MTAGSTTYNKQAALNSQSWYSHGANGDKITYFNVKIQKNQADGRIRAQYMLVEHKNLSKYSFSLYILIPNTN